MKKFRSIELAENLKEVIDSREFLEKARKKPADFTRDREMPFSEMIYFMLNLIRSTTGVALDRFLNLVFEIRGRKAHMTQQSFSESREKLRWEGCRYLLDKLVEMFYQSDYEKWHGYRLMAIDGSKLQLPEDAKLKSLYGTAGRGDTSVTALGSVLYDTLNGITLDANLAPISTSERKLASLHIQRLRGMPSFSRELVLFDRGYASFQLIQDLLEGEKPVNFLFRLRTKFNLEIDSMPLGIHYFTLSRGGKSYQLRVVKFKLNSTETETLLTNLLDDLSLEDFKKLYFRRWPIKGNYNILKNKLCIENFSSRTQNAILQDFFLTYLASNLVTVLDRDAQPIADARRKGKRNKYEYAVNRNQSIGKMKDRLVKIALMKDPEKRIQAMIHLIVLLSGSVVPRRPGRNIPRKPNPRKANYCFNQKMNC